MIPVSLKHKLRMLLARRGYNLYRMTEAEQQQVLHFLDAVDSDADLAASDFQLETLSDLRARYAELDLPAVIHSAWARRSASDTSVDTGLGGVELSRFRAQSAYVWAYADANVLANRMRYYLFADYVRKHDPLGLLDRLSEDGAYGCLCFDFEGFPLISRDLLDSVLELNALQQHYGLLDENCELRVLDIGAGYGRLAARLAEAGGQPKQYTAVDAVAESTALCEYYLNAKRVGERFHVAPLDDFVASDAQYDLAINIHSFSECTQASIRWWLEQMTKRGVKQLFLVPNEGRQCLSTETDHSRKDFAGDLEQAGFRLVDSAPMFEDADIRELTGIHDWYLYYERS